MLTLAIDTVAMTLLPTYTELAKQKVNYIKVMLNKWIYRPRESDISMRVTKQKFLT